MTAHSQDNSSLPGGGVPPADAGSTARPRTTYADRRGRIATEGGRFGILLLLVVVVVGFSIAKPASYGTVDNFRAILDNQAVVVILAIGTMLPLIAGEFDLSVASVLALTAAMVVGLQAWQGLSPIAAIAASLAIAAAVGLVNGFVVVNLKVPAFVGTLGTGTLLSGIWLWYLGDQTIVTPLPHYFMQIGQGSVLGIPLPVVYMAVIVLVGSWALAYLPVGRRLYAVGFNRRAAHLTGIRTDRYVRSAFLASALLAGIAGVTLGAELGTATPGTGADLLLPAFAGAFLGATTIVPGRFNVLGTVVAVYALAFMISGLEQFGVTAWVVPVFNGGTLVLAVALSGWAVRRKAQLARRANLRQLALHTDQQSRYETEPEHSPSGP